eukprot:CAMPEP_0206223206 /NCGR_PEP_ID=MMETSP0047_2-20121206/6365_1 /ASSEMBLY_ACC=CAM_ASM_000192 /TAXON_ID=195065 /ORGANISM="Chroomonas mesostigmatica_cf, Strain CCMP1168" /LENGTH=707 /DNA_ID=CAMNT_0053646073 /DNA_START=132 /DNA_END=2255 /DNA_ORIENTATION=-
MPRAAGRRAKDAKAGRHFPDELSSVCLVFAKDEAEQEKDATRGLDEPAQRKDRSHSQQIRQPLVDKLRAADLIVRETCSRDNDEVFVLVSASEKRQRQVAQIMGNRKWKGLLKLRYRQMDDQAKPEKNEGAFTVFRQKIAPLYERSSEGTLFSSLQQQQILEFILNDQDESVMGPQLVQKDNLEEGNTPLDQLVRDGALVKFFRLHHPKKREELTKRWVYAWYNKQPIEDIREYYGEKIALYFVFLGYYTTMLWTPALSGGVLFLSQLWSHHTTGSMDNPWVPLYCCFTAVWGIVFITGWRRLERAYQYEWGTHNFEEEEEDRREFIQNKHTRQMHCEYRDEVERYPDPNWRNLALATSATVVSLFICTVVSVVSAIAYMKFQLLKILEPQGLAVLGKCIGGGSQAISIMIFNRIYQVVLKKLTAFENWRTETEYEDATIAKDFCFKFVNAYFACFFVAFVQNNIKIFGEDMHCPEWHCMPELTMTLASVFVVQMTVAQTLEVGLPIIRSRYRGYQEETEMRKKQGLQKGDLVPEMSEEERQSKLSEMVVQFGYVTLFAAAFPLTASLALGNNLIEIRTDAFKLLQATQRPPAKKAANIGTWGIILDIITTAAILTNCALVGFTSHGLFFYLPDLDPVNRVWVTVLVEHILLLFKVILEALLNEPPKEAVEAYERREFLKDKILQECEYMLQDDGDAEGFYTDDEDE